MHLEPSSQGPPGLLRPVLSSALVPGKEGWGKGGSLGGRDRVAMGVQCGAQGLFFTAGGRRDHIKFFITDLQEMRELYITLPCLASCFLLFLLQNSSRKEKCRRQMRQGWVQIRRDQGDRDPAAAAWTVLRRLAPGRSLALGRTVTGPRGNREKEWLGTRCPLP